MGVVDLDALASFHQKSLVAQSQFKKRKVISDHGNNGSCSVSSCEIKTSLPTLLASDYFMEPCLNELAARELIDPGYCSRVQNFTVGRYGYGTVRFLGKTDVRWLDLDQIIKFKRHEIVVYEDETVKPVVGNGLNKPAEVTLVLQMTSSKFKGQVTEKLRLSSERQGAEFISFDPNQREWKFSVCHFSRFGLSDDEEEDVAMDDVDTEVQEPVLMTNDSDGSDLDEERALVDPRLLSHSLPSHLGLDPVRMKEMRTMMFPSEDDEELDGTFSHHHQVPFGKEHTRSLIQHNSRSSPPAIRKTPLALLEYNPGTFASSPTNGSILLTQQNKGLPLTITKVQGFKLELKEITPVTRNYSRNVVDAALFMGRSFGIAWGPNGLLLHCGSTNNVNKRELSSTINLEKVAIDNVVRDENNKVREELIDSCFDSPLSFHKEIDHETKDVVVDSFKIKVRKLVCDRLSLSRVCRSYIGIIEKQLEVPGLSSSARVVLMHQVLVWELIKVLFSTRETSDQSNFVGHNNHEEYMMNNNSKSSSLDVDVEALPLIRRAEFSYWLQESVCHRVQDEISSLNDSTSDLQHLFLLLTGRQLDSAVQLSASRGDVRLACLLSQAGGSTVNRTDIDRQLNLWKTNGLDFSFIEDDRIRLFELLAGNIHKALGDVNNIDWKRFLGLLMWYHLSPDSDLTVIFQTYQRLLEDGRAPHPVPVYIDEGLLEDRVSYHFDLAYYLMLLHGSEEKESNSMLKTMFSAFASTHDPLDHHMIWHQRAVLEAVGTFSCDDLHVLDMGLVSQLLCLGHCHWAIYVVLHMSYRDDCPYLQAHVIREILFQYCETWSAQENQRRFIEEELGIPSAWLHEALAIYHAYYRDSFKALEHYIGCAFWQKAHSTFISSVAHSLFLSGKHSEIWRLATCMEDHKSEIENWDLGAGIYISFYTLRSSLEEDDDTMTELVSLENKNDACRDFFSRLKGSLAVWESCLPTDARMVYAKMAEDISDLLVADSGEGSTTEVKLSCFDTIFESPIPEDLLSCHLQSAVSHFTLHLMESAS